MKIHPWLKEFPRFETERLVLRRITVEDAVDILDHYSQEAVTHFLDIESIHTRAEAEQIIGFFERGYQEGRWIRWGIEFKQTGHLIGTAGFNNWELHRGFYGEIGFDLSSEYWGQGIMIEALEPLIQFGFEEIGLNRIEALVMLHAEQAMNVLEKLGFIPEGIRREYGFWKGRYWDELCYSLLRREWKARRGG